MNTITTTTLDAATGALYHTLAVSHLTPVAKNLFVCDSDNDVVRRIATSSAQVTTVSGYTASDLQSVAVDSSGSLYLTDGFVSKKVIKIAGSPGASSALATAAYTPTGVAVDASVDIEHNSVKKISSGSVTVLAGDWFSRSMDGLGTAARFDSPEALAIGSDGDFTSLTRATTVFAKSRW